MNKVSGAAPHVGPSGILPATHVAIRLPRCWHGLASYCFLEGLWGIHDGECALASRDDGVMPADDPAPYFDDFREQFCEQDGLLVFYRLSSDCRRYHTVVEIWHGENCLFECRKPLRSLEEAEDRFPTQDGTRLFFVVYDWYGPDFEPPTCDPRRALEAISPEADDAVVLDAAGRAFLNALHAMHAWANRPQDVYHDEWGRSSHVAVGEHDARRLHGLVLTHLCACRSRGDHDSPWASAGAAMQRLRRGLAPLLGDYLAGRGMCPGPPIAARLESSEDTGKEDTPRGRRSIDG